MRSTDNQYINGGSKVFLEHLAGLRGFAILCILFYHMYGRGVWASGYLGVDIFLVITGYLLFRKRVDQNKATTWWESAAFLGRRVQRIVPSMLVLILTTMIAGMVMLWWSDMILLSKQGYAACLARANSMLQREFANYFAGDSAYMPLLHMWYLSVILQVYLLFALCDQALQRLPRRFIFCILMALGFASLLYRYADSLVEYAAALGLPITGQVRPVSYYQLTPRIWEVLAGGLICILPTRTGNRLPQVAAVGGLVLMCLPILTGGFPALEFSKHLSGTLCVVTGAVLTLRYAPECRFVHALLRAKILLWLGKISFSLYLVHMPVIVFMRLWAFGQPSVLQEFMAFLISLVLSVVFWKYVEKRKFAWWLILALWIATLVLCREGRKTSGFRDYLPSSSWEIPTYSEWKMSNDTALENGLSKDDFPLFPFVFQLMNQDGRVPHNFQAPLMIMGDGESKATCVLMGDSHAAALFAGMDAGFKQEKIHGVYLASYIYPLHGWEEDKKPDWGNISSRERALMSWLRLHPEITHVIIAQRWWYRFNDSADRVENALRIFIQELRDCGKKVVLIGPTPEFPQQAALLHYDKIFALQGKDAQSAEQVAAVCSATRYNELNKTCLPILRKLQNEGLCTLVEPLQTLEPGEVFHTLQKGKLLMVDGDHMNPGASLPLVRKMLPKIKSALVSP